MTRVCLIPAAGASSRMRGADKLLEDVDGAPCLRVLAARAAEADAQVIVTLPRAGHPRSRALAGSPAQQIFVPNAAKGLSESLKAGARAVPRAAHGLMILPGDMPDISTADMTALWEAFEAHAPVALRACTARGLPGHPTIIAPGLLPAFAMLSGDQGANGILKARAADVVMMVLDGNKARCDLDTPEDWAAWRAAQT